MSVDTNITVLRCDWRGCDATFYPRIPKGRRDLRITAIDRGWRCTKRGQWTDICPDPAHHLDIDREGA